MLPNQTLDLHSGVQLVRMRRLAVSVLLLAAVLMVVFRFLEGHHPWAGFCRAFCEAATVGAMADWFAVVALFRRPLGLPIPHTAILPNNKARVADSLATFLETNFLTETQLGPKFRGIDYAAFSASWLEDHADFLAQKAAGYAPKILEGFSDAEMIQLLAERAKAMVLKAELAPIASEGLGVLVQNGRDREIFRFVLRTSEEWILSNRAIIQSKIREEIPIPTDLLGNVLGMSMLSPILEQLKDRLAGSVAEKTIEKIRKMLAEAEVEPDHALWVAFDDKLRGFIDDLKSSEEMAGKIRSMQEKLAESQVVEDFAAMAWQELKGFLLRDCASSDSLIHAKLRDALLGVARQLREHDGVCAGVNTFLGEQVLKGILAARPHVRELVVGTITNWDSNEMSDKLENSVGADLQFIRLNGTLIGGLIGLIIHVMFTVIFPQMQI